MPLNPGARLGPYEVIAPLGVGGMGEVYRARDTTLNRDVAIKALPDWSLLPSDLPPMLKVYLPRCLQKNPKERVQDIGDVRLALQGAFDAPASAPPALLVSLPDPLKIPARSCVWPVAVGLALVAGGGAAAWLLKPSLAPRPAPRGRFAIATGSPGLVIASSLSRRLMD